MERLCELAVLSLVGGALREGASRIPAAVPPSRSPEAEGGAWERYGLPGRAFEQEEYSLALAGLLAELDRRLVLAA